MKTSPQMNSHLACSKRPARATEAQTAIATRTPIPVSRLPRDWAPCSVLSVLAFTQRVESSARIWSSGAMNPCS